MLLDPVILLDPVALLQKDYWRLAHASFPVSEPAETGELSLLQQELQFERRLDREMYRCLELETEGVSAWVAAQASIPYPARLNDYLAFVQPNLVADEILNFAPDLVFAQARQPDSRAWQEVSAWTEQCKLWAQDLLRWRLKHPRHPAAAPLALWFDDPGLLPQARLLIWSLRVPTDPLAEKIMARHRAHRKGLYPVARAAGAAP